MVKEIPADDISVEEYRAMEDEIPDVIRSAISFFKLSELYKIPKREIEEMLEYFVTMAFIRSRTHSSLKSELSTFLSTLEGTAGIYPEIVSDKEGDEDKADHEILFEYIADALGIPETHYWRK